MSLHCVRAYGHMLEALQSLPVEAWPPKVMLHSYGGSAEMVPQFAALPQLDQQADDSWAEDAGGRVYFSFSAAIAAKTPDKTAALMRVVPDDRLLIETDLGSVEPMNEALRTVVQMVADAKGWDVERATEQTWANFCEFYEGHL